MTTAPGVGEAAKADFLRAKEALVKGFRFIPEEKRLWSPAPTARNAVEILHHCATALGHIRRMYEGTPFGAPDPNVADAEWRVHEANITDGDAVLAEFEAESDRMVAFFDGLSQSDLDSRTITLPFGLGQAPLAAGLSAAADHTRSHVPQLEYLQTCLGDRDWHFRD